MCLKQLISISLILRYVAYIISANSLYRFRLLYLRLAKKGVSNVYISFAINTVLSTLSCRYWLPRFSNLYTHTDIDINLSLSKMKIQFSIFHWGEFRTFVQEITYFVILRTSSTPWCLAFMKSLSVITCFFFSFLPVVWHPINCPSYHVIIDVIN